MDCPTGKYPSLKRNYAYGSNLEGGIVYGAEHICLWLRRLVITPDASGVAGSL